MKLIFLPFFSLTFHAISLFGFNYDGFYLNDTIFLNDPNHQKILRTNFQKQVDQINSIEFSPSLSALLHHIPITAVRIMSPMGKTVTDWRARYHPLKTPLPISGSIELNTVYYSNSNYNPTYSNSLLHEFMHAIHDIYIPAGMMSPKIIGFYTDAKKYGCYGYSDKLALIKNRSSFPHKEYLFYNPQEFFACTASTFLLGTSIRHPFLREEIENEQPEYFAFLQKLFDPNASIEDSNFNPINNWYHLEHSTY